MVGYSALTQKNEALALELLSEHRQILRPVFAEHGGREIETAGDSFFCRVQQRSGSNKMRYPDTERT